MSLTGCFRRNVSLGDQDSFREKENNLNLKSGAFLEFLINWLDSWDKITKPETVPVNPVHTVSPFKWLSMVFTASATSLWVLHILNIQPHEREVLCVHRDMYLVWFLVVRYLTTLSVSSLHRV
jgi:hypothetical protein